VEKYYWINEKIETNKSVFTTSKDVSACFYHSTLRKISRNTQKQMLFVTFSLIFIGYKQI